MTGDTAPVPQVQESKEWGGLVPYFVLGGLLGLGFVKAEVISWFRMQEMFRFQSFHMFGVIGSAVVVAAVMIQVVRRTGTRSFRDRSIEIPAKVWGRRGSRYWIGGVLFGVGWGLTGACPGPIFALLGAGVSVYVVVLVGALLGTYAYGALRPKLPHD